MTLLNPQTVLKLPKTSSHYNRKNLQLSSNDADHNPNKIHNLNTNSDEESFNSSQYSTNSERVLKIHQTEAPTQRKIDVRLLDKTQILNLYLKLNTNSDKDLFYFNKVFNQSSQQKFIFKYHKTQVLSENGKTD